MANLLGVDIGTSSVKALILNASTGETLAVSTHEYPLYTPQSGYAEQNPADWWAGTVAAVNNAVTNAGVKPDTIRAIGLSGQMHGTVCLKDDYLPACPAIIWTDSRSTEQHQHLQTTLSSTDIVDHSPGQPATGFMGLTLAWLAENSPDTLDQTWKVILPKDYVRLRLTGEMATDHTDAAGTWLYDITRREWSDWMMQQCRVDPAAMPSIIEPTEMAGRLHVSAAADLGLSAGIPVAGGAADQAAQALGHGILHSDTVLITVGSGGQVLRPLTKPQVDPELRAHTFTHIVPDRWYMLAAILSAGLSLRWLRDTFGATYEALSELADGVPPGADGLVFLPYLAGERTPHMDPAASGAFIGLRLHHNIGHMARAVMEGVVFALVDCLDIVKDFGDKPTCVIGSGGALTSSLWRQILVDVLNQRLYVARGEHHATVGASLLGGVAAGVYSSIEQAIEVLNTTGQVIEPDQKASTVYAERRSVFRRLYGRLRDDMHDLNQKT